jgi:hypothetical protein
VEEALEGKPKKTIPIKIVHSHCIAFVRGRLVPANPTRQVFNVK